MHNDSSRQQLESERMDILHRLQDWLELPMLVLAFVWLALFVVEVVWGLSPFLEAAGYAIWAAFVVEFLVGFLVAPQKLRYLRQNWLKIIALIAPALRIFRVLSLLRLARLSRVAGMTRSLRLLRLVSSINRGMKALGASMQRRGFGYVVLLTLIVTLVGAAGMYAFEGATSGGQLASYSEALWWTAMIMTTMGSEYWPRTGEGRALCFILALYSFTVFGYVTASLSTYFIGRDAEDDRGEVAGVKSQAALREEIGALRDELRRQRNSAASRDSGKADEL